MDFYVFYKSLIIRALQNLLLSCEWTFLALGLQIETFPREMIACRERTGAGLR